MPLPTKEGVPDAVHTAAAASLQTTAVNVVINYSGGTLDLLPPDLLFVPRNICVLAGKGRNLTRSGPASPQASKQVVLGPKRQLADVMQSQLSGQETGIRSRRQLEHPFIVVCRRNEYQQQGPQHFVVEPISAKTVYGIFRQN
jgi:hypothetical protein